MKHASDYLGNPDFLIVGLGAQRAHLSETAPSNGHLYSLCGHEFPDSSIQTEDAITDRKICSACSRIADRTIGRRNEAFACSVVDDALDPRGIEAEVATGGCVLISPNGLRALAELLADTPRPIVSQGLETDHAESA